MQQEAPTGPAGCHKPASYSPSDTTLAAFETHAEAWEQYTNTPLGRLREELTLHYLARHLDVLPTRASVLDVGGGTGGYSLALAELGYQVCLLDFSAQMLAAARGRAEKQGADVVQRMRFYRAAAEDVPTALAAQRFDLVLCHTLLEYVEDPDQVLRGLSAALRPGGLLSLLYVNTYASPLRWALAKGDLEQAQRSLETEVSSADLFGLPRRTFTAGAMREAMSRAGIEPLAQYGVRVLADYVPAHRLSEPAFWARLFELEASAGSRSPYKEIARYGYLLGRKPLTGEENGATAQRLARRQKPMGCIVPARSAFSGNTTRHVDAGLCCDPEATRQTSEENRVEETGFSIGIGLTNDCNLSCAHCYRPTDQVYCLSLEEVQTICQHLPVSAMGMGTGENSLHPQFVEIVGYLRAQGVKLSMASNGHSLNTMPEEVLCAFHDVEVSIDYPNERDQDLFRGEGNWRKVHAAMARCQALGIEVSILATLMNTNYDQMGALARLARSRGTNLRVNVYQSVQTDRFALSYAQFWEAYRQLFASAQLVSCSEPVVRAVLGLEPVLSPCGRHSIRCTPQGIVTPCVYWPGSTLTIDDVRRLGKQVLETPEFEQARQVPPVAADCPCQGGCASRRALSGKLNQHDPYCPWARGDEIALEAEMAPGKDLTRARNVCTTIVV